MREREREREIAFNECRRRRLHKILTDTQAIQPPNEGRKTKKEKEGEEETQEGDAEEEGERDTAPGNDYK